MKHILTWGLLIASVFSLILLITTDASDFRDLNAALESAKKYEQEGLYVKAIEGYRKAVSLSEDNYDYKLKIVENYEKLGDMDSVVSLCGTLVSAYPDKIDSYLKLVNYYKTEDEMEQYVPALQKTAKQFPDNEEVIKHVQELEKMWQVDPAAFDNITMFVSGKALADYTTTNEEEEMIYYTVMDEYGADNGKRLQYDKVRFTDTMGQYVVKTDEGWQIINSEEYPIAKCKEDGIEEMGPSFQGLSYAVKGNKYYLVNSELKLSSMSWDYVGSFSDGIAPVKIGNKWGFIGLNSITADPSACKYEDIAVDEFGRCYINERIFVKENGKYYMINAKGEKVVDTGFEDVKVFATEQPAAVKQNGKWGFLSKDGEMVIKPQFEEAMSFSNGYAAIRKGDKWGVLNAYGTIVVEPQFKEVKYASSKGIIPVKNIADKWDLLKMYKLYYLPN